MKKGILLCGHGTRVKNGAEAFKKFAEDFKLHLEGYEFSAGFLELSEPDFEQGIKNLVEKGVHEIIAIPLFLFTGVHIEKDIPYTLFKYQEKYGVKIRMGKYLGVCDEMVTVCENLIQKAIPKEILENSKDTALVVAGVGSSKIKANGDLAAMTRLVQEKFRIPFSTYGFLSKMTFPSLENTLANISLLPYKNVIILPYFFFQGIYIQRAMNAVKRIKKQNEDKEFLVTDLLGSEDTLYEILTLRIKEVLEEKIDLIANIDKEMLHEYEHHHHHHGHHHH